ncbi:MAG: hypothetical protein MJZ73_12245 [Bacteroidaceae bacterium]|nr:hypothetical protein [Bacteroidaceae bacterium]
MKKIIFAFIALICSTSISAQVMKIMKNGQVIATYSARQADEVVFEDAPESLPTASDIFNYGAVIDIRFTGPDGNDYHVGFTNDNGIYRSDYLIVNGVDFTSEIKGRFSASKQNDIIEFQLGNVSLIIDTKENTYTGSSGLILLNLTVDGFDITSQLTENVPPTASDAFVDGTQLCVKCSDPEGVNYEVFYVNQKGIFILTKVNANGMDVTSVVKDQCSAFMQGEILEIKIGRVSISVNTKDNTYTCTTDFTLTGFIINDTDLIDELTNVTPHKITAKDILDDGTKASIKLKDLFDHYYEIFMENSNGDLTITQINADDNDMTQMLSSQCSARLQGDVLEVTIGSETFSLNTYNNRYKCSNLLTLINMIVNDEDISEQLIFETE